MAADLTVPCACCGQLAEAGLLQATIPVALVRQIEGYAEATKDTLDTVVQNAIMYYLKLKEMELEHLAEQAKADEDDKPWD